MLQMKTFLLPVDFSERSLEAAREAKALAKHFHSRLIMLNVMEADRRTGLQFEPGGSSVEELRAYFDREYRDEPIDYVVETGDPAETIMEQAEACGADLIVMASHNRSAFESFAFGSVTAEVLSMAKCPVWVSVHCQKGPAPLFQRILCGLALADPHEKTLVWALEFADAFQARCDVIHVSPDGDGQPAREDTLLRAQREEVAHIRERLGKRGEVLLADGELGQAVYRASKNIASDLLVIGRSSPGNAIGRVHSASYRLVHEAACPVVSV
ncbi:MAG TPA: universal stress protein [Bryobacteraceae bacterium]|nr:universal stress protein [Bryobacteraceae bacterium]